MHVYCGNLTILSALSTPRDVDVSESQLRGNHFYALENVRHRALAARRRRAAPAGIAAVRAKGAYVFYYVEVIPATLAVKLSTAPTAWELPFRPRKRKPPAL